MQSDVIYIDSENLSRMVEIPVYGHFGSSLLLLFSTEEDDPYENEENGLIPHLSQYIKAGKVRIYSLPIPKIWDEIALSNEERSKILFNFNNFIVEELLAKVYNHCGQIVPILTAGASKGAFYALNTYFRRPDLFLGTIAMNGKYDIYCHTKGYFDDNCYFNSPIHYLPNLNDNYWLTFLRSRHHVYLMSGKGYGEDPSASYHLSSILTQKQIPHTLDIWGEEWGHNIDTWKAMLAKIIHSKF
ncbi:MAG TPA: esterase [Candidatus Kapabacteria bacterium]|nr:esterase [Candidatus Kapabacteria bacterium]